MTEQSARPSSGTRMKLRTRLARPDEKSASWPICDRHDTLYADYRVRRTREIPILVSEPRP